MDNAQLERMPIVIGGHVDHGKSTIIGRLLADSGSLPEGKLEQVRATCARNSKPFEYAFLLDALKDEQSQGITIDVARVFFRTPKREYLIIDAPGHIEFLKNMITGASRAEAALLVIDAKEGVQENSRRHGYMLSLLGIHQFAVLVNKMDLVDYSEEVYRRTVQEYTDFLEQIDVQPLAFLPLSGREGENLVGASREMPWYDGPSVIGVLDRFESEALPVDQPLRMPVQGVYKFTAQGDDRRIVAGTIATGTLSVGDQVIFYPSGKQGRIKTIEGFNQQPHSSVTAGVATGFTLEEQVYVTRGELVARSSEPRPHVTTRLRASVFWLGKRPLEPGRDYQIKLGASRTHMRLEAVHRVIDASDLSTREEADKVERHDVAEVTLKLSRAMAFDVNTDLAETSRFVIVDDYEIRGGGIIREALPDQQDWVREKVFLRNAKWEPSNITAEQRANKYNQKAALLLITGSKDADRKTIAKDLEAALFQDGKVVYFLGIGSVLYGVDADIERTRENHDEHIRRLAEVANILLDAGVILIVTAQELTQEDLDLMRTTVDPDRIDVVWVGDHISTDLVCDLHLGEDIPPHKAVEMIERRLQDRGVIFRP